MGPRNPVSLRASSTASLHTLDPGIASPPTPTTHSDTPSPTTATARKKRSTGSVRDKGERTSERGEKGERSEKGEKENEGKDGKKSGKSPKGAVAVKEDRTRPRTTPTLPHSTIDPAPATLMYWSKAPVYGTLPPHLRAHTVTLIDNIAWLFGGCDEKLCWKDIWWFNTETMQWMHPEAQGDIPPPCRAHTATLVDRRLVVFGGGEGPVYRNDVYVLDTLTRRWQQPVFPVDAPQPPPRRAHTAVLYKGKVWVFGGGNGSQALNDLWTLDVNVPVERMKWEEQRTRGKAPVARGYHTANLVGNVMIIMGGSDGKECFSDIWCLNLDTLIWSMVRLDVVHRRLSHTATQVGSYLFIWGGHDGTSYTSEILLFNLGASCGFHLHPNKHPHVIIVSLNFETRPIAGKKPIPRGYHAAVLADSRLFIFGGFNGTEVFDDVQMLDLAGAAYLPQVTSFKIDVE
ncbi:unnamed protein product [Somion occarium]|uniref:Galactose oxidase n=1 Tax=Somion occarium TaxID=3059160 RepID=A0ABP1CT72_9APHY